MSRPRLFAFPLASASLCANCESISNSRTDACPQCGGRGGLIPLAKVLGQLPQHEERARVIESESVVGERYEFAPLMEIEELRRMFTR